MVTPKVAFATKKEKWMPPNWQKELDNIYKMRSCRDAPVDTMGCDKISDETASPEVRFCTVGQYIA